MKKQLLSFQVSVLIVCAHGYYNVTCCWLCFIQNLSLVYITSIIQPSFGLDAHMRIHDK